MHFQMRACLSVGASSWLTNASMSCGTQADELQEMRLASDHHFYLFSAVGIELVALVHGETPRTFHPPKFGKSNCYFSSRARLEQIELS